MTALETSSRSGTELAAAGLSSRAEPARTPAALRMLTDTASHPENPGSTQHQPSDRHRASLPVTNSSSLSRHLGFYVRKHGLARCLTLALDKVRTRFLGHWEWVYFVDLPTLQATPEPVVVLQRITAEDQLDADSLTALAQFKSPRAVAHFLKKWFARGATLWVAKVEDDVVGVQWTLERGFDGFYSVPVAEGEVIVVAVEIFPPFRGRGLYPQAALALMCAVKRMGLRRLYLKVECRNQAMQRSMKKTPCRRLGRVFTTRCFGRWLCLWAATTAEDDGPRTAPAEGVDRRTPEPASGVTSPRP